MARALDPDVGRSPEMPLEEDPGYDGEVDGVKITRRGNSAVVDFNPGASRMSNLEHETAGVTRSDLRTRNSGHPVAWSFRSEEP